MPGVRCLFAQAGMIKPKEVRNDPSTTRDCRCVRVTMPGVTARLAGASWLPGVIPDELEAAFEDGPGVVVERRDVVAVGAFTHGHLVARHPGQQRAHAGRTDHVVGRAPVDE